jgi:hypothetical protein
MCLRYSLYNSEVTRMIVWFVTFTAFFSLKNVMSKFPFRMILCMQVLYIYTVEPSFYVPEIYVLPTFATFFRPLQFPYAHSALFSSILRFQNFKLPAIYIFRALTECTFLHKMATVEITSAGYIFRVLTGGTVLT